MDNGLFISLLNPAISLTLASAFSVLWLYQRQRPHLAVLAAAYALTAAGFLLQQFTLPVGLPITRLISAILFFVAAVSLSGAIISRYGRDIPFLALAILAVGGISAFSWFMFVDPDLTWRIYSLNFALGGMALLVAAELRALPQKGPTEKLLLGFSLLCGANFFLRVIVAVKLHGPFESYEGFANSLYWTTSVLSHALLSLLVALCLVTAAALDVMRELWAVSLTDPLSGLLNRRGFENRATGLLALSGRTGLPLSLVVADLDRFKVLNDKYGHAAGDRVIDEFAARLRMAAGARGVAGRLGGEEFAILLPLADLAAARLLAEAIRAVFSAEPIHGLPREVRVSASFGVAQRCEGESFAELFARADEAMYRAKKGGRDSVRISYQRPADPALGAARVA